MRLTTQRLILREFVLDDWPAVLTYQQDPRYLRFYPWSERGEDDVRAFVGMFLEQQTERASAPVPTGGNPASGRQAHWQLRNPAQTGQ